MSGCLAPLTGVTGLDDSLDVLVHPFPELHDLAIWVVALAPAWVSLSNAKIACF